MLKVLILLLTFTYLNAYQDYDMDGVEDRVDRCPNTLMSELVNHKGCPIKNLDSYHHFDFIYGLNFYQTNYDTLEKANTHSQSFQFDYYYKNLSVTLSSSYYTSNTTSYNDSGSDDSFLGVYYKIDDIKNLNITMGVGTIIPTYDSDLNNNNTDYSASINLNYGFENLKFFGGYSYTLINDDDIEEDNLIYRNTNAINIGLGYYFTQELYMSSSYSTSESIFEGVENIEVAALYALYSLNKNWFTNFTYAYGVSDSASDNFASLKVGYYF